MKFCESSDPKMFLVAAFFFAYRTVSYDVELLIVKITKFKICICLDLRKSVNKL